MQSLFAKSSDFLFEKTIFQNAAKNLPVRLFHWKSRLVNSEVFVFRVQNLSFARVKFEISNFFYTREFSTCFLFEYAIFQTSLKLTRFLVWFKISTCNRILVVLVYQIKVLNFYSNELSVFFFGKTIFQNASTINPFFCFIESLNTYALSLFIVYQIWAFCRVHFESSEFLYIWALWFFYSRRQFSKIRQKLIRSLDSLKISTREHWAQCRSSEMFYSSEPSTFLVQKTICENS